MDFIRDRVPSNLRYSAISWREISRSTRDVVRYTRRVHLAVPVGSTGLSLLLTSQTARRSAFRVAEIYL